MTLHLAPTPRAWPCAPAPVWEGLEQHWRPQRRARDGASRLVGTLHPAQAQSNRGRGGRKQDYPDAERLVKRVVAQELTLSFVPDAEETTGIKVVTTTGQSQGPGVDTIPSQLRRGVPADVVVLSKEGLDELAAAHLVRLLRPGFASYSGLNCSRIVRVWITL